MQKKFVSVLMVFALMFSVVAYAAEGKSSKKKVIPKPTAQQVFKYVEEINKDSKMDRKEAEKVLSEWMAGKLSADSDKMKEFEKQPRDATSCAVCMAGCAGIFGANPFCVAACIAGACK